MMGLRQFTLIAALSLTILVIEFAPGCHGRTLIAKGNTNILRKNAFHTDDGSLRNRVDDGSRSDLEESWKKDVAGEFNEEAKVSENEDVEKKELWSLLRRLANLVDIKQKNVVKNGQVLDDKSKFTSCVDDKDGKNCVLNFDDKDGGNSGDGGSGSGESGNGSGDQSGDGEEVGSGSGGSGSGGESGDDSSEESGSGRSVSGASGGGSSEESGSGSSEESDSGIFQPKEIESENLEQTVAKVFEGSRSTSAQMIRKYGGQITWEDKIQLLKQFLDILKRKTEK